MHRGCVNNQPVHVCVCVCVCVYMCVETVGNSIQSEQEPANILLIRILSIIAYNVTQNRVLSSIKQRLVQPFIIVT